MLVPKKKIPVIAIDGPSSSGKGTIARQVAHTLHFHLLDSGALYRLVALKVAREGRVQGTEPEIAQMAANLDVRFSTNDAIKEQVWLSGEEVCQKIRTEECGRLASTIAALPMVREALLKIQKSFRKSPGLVADGRDMGTTVFPEAILKIFLTASVEERARRRLNQLKDKGIDVSLAALSRDIEDRDRRDSDRPVAPLRQADDARFLDSSNLTIDEVRQIILGWLKEVGAA